VNARVVWVRGDRVYVATRDSAALAGADRLRFHRGKRPVATAVIIAMPDPWLAIALVDSGSLTLVDHLDRLDVLGENRSGRLARLRVGYPSRRRRNPIFACDRMKLQSPAGYRVIDSLAASRGRAIRDLDLHKSWPDTLELRTFDQSADEEIALERGELDVAVFWPGELSTHLRDSRRWQSDLLGQREFGLLRAAWDASDPKLADGPGDLDLPRWNVQLFGGDLTPFPFDSSAMRRSLPRRFAAGPSLPGGAIIERFLNRGVSPDAPVIRLEYIDAEVFWLRDQLRSLSTDASAGRRDLFAIRCPVVCAPALRARIALLADALANLMRCEAEHPSR
jgi:hypothetical protein